MFNSSVLGSGSSDQGSAGQNGEAQFHHWVGLIPNLSYRIDPTGIVLWINPDAASTLQRAPEDVVGKRFDELFPPEQTGYPWPEIVSLLDRRGLLIFAHALRLPARELWVETRLTSRPSQTGESREIVGVTREVAKPPSVDGALRQSEEGPRLTQDITERKQAEEEIRRLAGIQRTILNTINIGISFLKDRKHQWVNPAFVAMFGYEADKLPGVDALVFYASETDYRRVGREGYAQLAAAGIYTTEALMKRQDGSRLWCSLTGQAINPNNLAEGTIWALRDITERKQAEAALRESEERLRLALEGADLGTWDWNVETGEITINERWARMLGYCREEIEPHLRAWEALVHPEDMPGVRHVVETHLEGRTPFYETEHRIRHKSGEWIWVLDRGRVISRDAAGKPLRAAGTHLDVTERKRLEAQLLQAQKMEAVGQLAGGVAHDFNNLLAAMMLQLGLLRGDLPQDAGVQAALGDLEALATQAANLTRQLLLFGRRSVMEIRPLELNALVHQLLKMLRRLLGEHIQIDFQSQESPLGIEADGAMINQVLMNLAVNARDAMPKGGRLLIQTALDEFGTDPATAMPGRPAGRFVRLSVTDTGCGMSPSTLQHVFEPFFTTKEVGKGTGLGLATVYGIIKQHHGWLEVESELGKGSTFLIWLPARDMAVAPPTANPAIEPAVGGGETILLVEDDPGVRRTMNLSLHRFGYQVIEAVNAAEALTIWKRRSEEIALLLTDMVMPGGTTGLELAEQLRSEKADLKVVLCSGYNTEIEPDASQRLPGMVYLPKPFGMPLLRSVVRACLDGRPVPLTRVPPYPCP